MHRREQLADEVGEAVQAGCGQRPGRGPELEPLRERQGLVQRGPQLLLGLGQPDHVRGAHAAGELLLVLVHVLAPLRVTYTIKN